MLLSETVIYYFKPNTLFTHEPSLAEKDINAIYIPDQAEVSACTHHDSASTRFLSRFLFLNHKTVKGNLS